MSRPSRPRPRRSAACSRINSASAPGSPGDRSQIVEETAMDVRDALNNSLAAAQAGHWQEAESLRLDAYTSFDGEIEARVLPRNPTLAMRTERSFIDGAGEEPGIKALIDRARAHRGTDRRLRAGPEEHGRMRHHPESLHLARHGRLYRLYRHRPRRAGGHRGARGAAGRDARRGATRARAAASPPAPGSPSGRARSPSGFRARSSSLSPATARSWRRSSPSWPSSSCSW